MFEHHSDPVISRRQWLKRLLRSIRVAARVIIISLVIGILGYHFLGNLNWIDSLLEASMILSGMGPVSPLQGDTVKIFASIYALFSGFILLAASGIVLAPIIHRFMHHFHAVKGK